MNFVNKLRDIETETYQKEQEDMACHVNDRKIVSDVITDIKRQAENAARSHKNVLEGYIRYDNWNLYNYCFYPCSFFELKEMKIRYSCTSRNKEEVAEKRRFALIPYNVGDDQIFILKELSRQLTELGFRCRTEIEEIRVVREGGFVNTFLGPWDIPDRNDGYCPVIYIHLAW